MTVFLVFFADRYSVNIRPLKPWSLHQNIHASLRYQNEYCLDFSDRVKDPCLKANIANVINIVQSSEMNKFFNRYVFRVISLHSKRYRMKTKAGKKMLSLLFWEDDYLLPLLRILYFRFRLISSSACYTGYFLMCDFLSRGDSIA